MEGEIERFNCFLVGEIPKGGALKLKKNAMTFTPIFGEENDLVINYTDIQKINAQTSLMGAEHSIEISTTDDTFVFSGLHEAPWILDTVKIIQQQAKAPLKSFGLTPPDKPANAWVPLEEPLENVNTTFSTNLATIVQMFENEDLFSRLYSACGNLEVALGPWVASDGYNERVISYTKVVTLPVLGTQHIQIKEFQRFFQLEGGGIGIHVISDLGKTPYADCFDPYVQIICTEEADKVRLVVNSTIVWKSEPFVKNIIAGQTNGQVKDQYGLFAKMINEELGAEVEDEATPEEPPENAFKKTKLIYRIIIYILLGLTVACFCLRYWPENGVHLGFRLYFGILSLLCLVLTMLYGKG